MHCAIIWIDKALILYQALGGTLLECWGIIVVALVESKALVM